ncbi:hypothetical protein CSA80_02605 [Candidatus Saccharibacteria bacterium]|nr:MAG: hypothetical protein CR973_02720 [Candidatus Saccharibacteria bacterium]PID98987.1 MAG: hypothetical protein CSA80_02605 [Candidatus Saccharibacteria bacterium]
MYFTDRTALGNALAENLKQLSGTDAILVCLKPSSMMVAIAMAIKLRAWILPLFYESIINPLNPLARLGAVAQNGEFCLDPTITSNDYDYISREYMNQLEEAKRTAYSKLTRAMNQYHGTTDPHILNNRSVVLVGDVMFNGIGLVVAKSLLKPLKPAAVYGSVGNVTIDVSDRFRTMTNETKVLDVLPSSVFGEEHYFEKPDAYSYEEKQALAHNIANYWA